MTTPDISLCMIIKNEADHLGRCLSSVQGLVSEIIIADTGSEDSSKGIAHQYGAIVIDIPWENDFSKARNECLKYATSPWILVLDADEAAEYWSDELLHALLCKEQIDGYWLPIKHYVGNEPHTDFVTDHVCRLFRKDPGIIFQGNIHEEVVSSIWALPGGEIAYAELPIHHYGYLEDELRRKHKYERNLALIRSQLQLHPNHVFLRYALGSEYYQQGLYQEAADILYPLLAEASDHSGYVSDIYLKTAYALQLSGRQLDAEDVYQAGALRFPDFTELLESYAVLLLEQGRWGIALQYLLQALKNGDTAHKYSSSSGSGTYRTELLTGRVCEKLLLYGNAREHYEAAIRFNPDYTEAWKELIPLSLLSGKGLELRRLSREYTHSLSPDTLSYLVPAALNSLDSNWLADLTASPQLPSSIQAMLEAILEINHQPAYPVTLEPLERLLHNTSSASERSLILGYLWAFSCQKGDSVSVIRWLICLSSYRPGMLTIHQILKGRTNLTATPSDMSYAAQLLLQTGAWDCFLELYRSSQGSSYPWSRLPQPLVYALLEAPCSIKKKWCAIHIHPHRKFHTPADPAEWLLYAAIACSCGEIPLLPRENEAAWRSSEGALEAIILAYYKLLLAGEAYPERELPSIPWALLLRYAASRT